MTFVGEHEGRVVASLFHLEGGRGIEGVGGDAIDLAFQRSHKRSLVN
jgi:hypothetical protein